MAAGDGLVSMTPTSIAHSGTSASINADGGVDFSAVTSVSLNGVFTGDYDNYLVVVSGDASSSQSVYARWRASGTDASGSDYTKQTLNAQGAAALGARTTGQAYGEFAIFRNGGLHNGSQVHVYGPYLAQPTAWRVVSVVEGSGAEILDRAFTHSLSTSYDGVSLLTLDADTLTGTVHVFGYEE